MLLALELAPSANVISAEEVPMRATAVKFHQTGGPEVLKVETVDLPAAAAGQVLIRQTAVGVNFLDTYQRSGAYQMPLPSGAGNEAAGVVEALGPGVTELRVGDRVAYAGGAPGAYASHSLYPAARLVKLPAGVSDETAAALMLKGMTVEYLMERCAPVKAGQYALMYAAAGGVGLVAGQWARDLGVKLIGVAGGADKCRLASDHGYFAVIDRNKEDIAARVKEITGGAGVPVVYDSIGKATFETTMKVLAPRGIFVSFGATSGLPPPVEAPMLQKLGSLYFTRPTLQTYCASRADLELSSDRLFAMVSKGAVKPYIGARYKLADAAQAHKDLEAGRTSGSSLLIP
jgi:NADPH2:quinone reductase